MSLQNYLEDLVGDLVLDVLPAFRVILGPITTPRAEGATRTVSIRHTGGRANRLEYAQSEWTESVAVTFYWPATVPRETAALEWDGFRYRVAINPSLVLTGDPVEGIRDGWVSASLWGEAADSHFRTMTATISVERVE